MSIYQEVFYQWWVQQALSWGCMFRSFQDSRPRVFPLIQSNDAVRGYPFSKSHKPDSYWHKILIITYFCSNSRAFLADSSASFFEWPNPVPIFYFCSRLQYWTLFMLGPLFFFNNIGGSTRYCAWSNSCSRLFGERYSLFFTIWSNLSLKRHSTINE